MNRVLQKTSEESTTTQCLAFQLEECPETGRAHLQGMVLFYNARSMIGVKEFLAKIFEEVRRLTRLSPWTSHKSLLRLSAQDLKPHLEPLKSTPKDLWEYSTKEETRIAGPWCFGAKPKGSGSRSELDRFVEDAKELKEQKITLATLQERHASIEAKYTKYFDRAVSRFQPKREWKTICVVLWGPPGTGKSQRALDMAKRLGQDPFYVNLPQTNRQQFWLDGYNDQDVMIMDEFKGGKISLSDFNRLTDKFPAQFQSKGSMINFRAKLLIITSNADPKQWYPFEASAYRRMDMIVRYKYHTEHVPDKDFNNADDCAEHAEEIMEKDNGAFEQLENWMHQNK